MDSSSNRQAHRIATPSVFSRSVLIWRAAGDLRADRVSHSHDRPREDADHEELEDGRRDATRLLLNAERGTHSLRARSSRASDLEVRGSGFEMSSSSGRLRAVERDDATAVWR